MFGLFFGIGLFAVFKPEIPRCQMFMFFCRWNLNFSTNNDDVFSFIPNNILYVVCQQILYQSNHFQDIKWGKLLKF